MTDDADRPGLFGEMTDEQQAETARAQAAEANIMQELTTITVAGGGVTPTQLTNETNRAEAAEGTIAIATGAETTRAEAAEGTLAGNITAEATARAGAITTEVTNRNTAISTAVGNEATRAEGVEATNAAAISTETTNRNTAVTGETTRATGAEGTLTTNLANEVTNRGTAVTAEQTRATTAEGTLTTNLAAEVTNRGTAVAGEATRAEGVEAGLSAQFTNVLYQSMDTHQVAKGLISGSTAVHDYLNAVSAAIDLRFKQASQAMPAIAMPTITETAPTSQMTGTNYYIDSVSGSDSNNGTSPSTPWQNITKLNGLSTANGSTIHLAADGVWTYADTWQNYKTHSTASFPYNSSDNLRSTSQTAPIIIKPYYPRGSTASKPQIAWYGNTQASDWTQVTTGGNPSITLNNVWRTSWTSTLNCNGLWVMFSNGTLCSVAAIQQVAGQVYGTNGNNPGQLLNPGDIAYDGTYLYVCAPQNPVTYFGTVWVTGAYSVFSSFWQGLQYVKFKNIQFNFCSAVTMSNASTAAVLGLEMEGCVANYGTLLNFNNQNTNSSPQMCSLSVHDCTVINSPYSAIYLTCGGTAGNSISWEVYRNKLFGGNLSASYGGALFYNQALGGTNHTAWQNYCYQARNGTGGNNIDGSGIYCDINSSDSLLQGNIFEQCGIGIQGNLAKTCISIGNLFVDCIAGVRSTGASGNNVSGCSYNVSNNTWIWTGRVAASSIPLAPGSGGINQPVFQEWNDGYNSYGNKFVYYTLCNNAAADVSGTFAGSKPFANYISTQITTLLITGNAAAGFGMTNVTKDNGTDTTIPIMVGTGIMGTTGDATSWFENAAQGSAKLALDSPLHGMGTPLSQQYIDIKGTPFNNVPSPGCYELPANRLY